MEGKNQVAVYVQKLRQQLVRQFRGQNLQIRNRTDTPAHSEVTSRFEVEGGRCDEIFGAHTGFQQTVVAEPEGFPSVHMESIVHDFQTVITGKTFGPDAHDLEIGHDVRFHTLQTLLCIRIIGSSNAECEIFYLHQAIVALCQLVLQHFGVLAADVIEVIAALGDTDHLLVFCKVDVLVHKGQLKMDRRVKVV